MPTEIERRFLLTALPAEIILHDPCRIQQAYTLINREHGCEERVRYYRDPNGGEHFRRYTKVGAGRAREEIFAPISVAEFTAAMMDCLGRPVIKDVYHEQYAGRWIEFHVFRSHQPLMTIEVEFGDAAAADRFHPPSWFGPEVTEDPRYNSAGVALHGVPDEYQAPPELLHLFTSPSSASED